jgi:aspartyl/asparaginyl-tRNA synthetase
MNATARLVPQEQDQKQLYLEIRVLEMPPDGGVGAGIMRIVFRNNLVMETIQLLALR